MTPPASWRDLSLVCPACRGRLEERSGATDPELVCRACGAAYPVILDIPDLRTRPDPYIGLEEDRAKGRTIAERCAGLDFAEALERYYEMTPVVTAAQARAFIASVLAAGDRATDTLDAFEAERGRPDGPLLDLGCGTAPLACAAASRYPATVGVDLAFRWLVVARSRLASEGVRLPLVCAGAEALPFADGTFARAVAESAVEHFEDQALALSETRRVLAPGGDLLLTTPNRFSLGPDPHVGLPAGGYLPDRWIAAYIRRRGGVPPRRRLLSAGSLRRLLEEAGFRGISIGLPRLGEARREALSGPLRLAAAAYGFALELAPARALLRRIGPLLSARAVRPGPSAARPGPSAASPGPGDRG